MLGSSWSVGGGSCGGEESLRGLSGWEGGGWGGDPQAGVLEALGVWQGQEG